MRTDKRPVKQVVIRTQFTALHCWPKAPPMVQFLQYPHRHIFHVELVLNVSHGDRQVEFFMMKQQLDSLIALELFATSSPFLYTQAMPYKDVGLPVLSGACEDMAEHLANALMTEFPHCNTFNVASVSIFEDGENGGRVVYQ